MNYHHQSTNLNLVLEKKLHKVFFVFLRLLPKDHFGNFKKCECSAFLIFYTSKLGLV